MNLTEEYVKKLGNVWKGRFGPQYKGPINLVVEFGPLTCWQKEPLKNFEQGHHMRSCAEEVIMAAERVGDKEAR